MARDIRSLGPGDGANNLHELALVFELFIKRLYCKKVKRDSQIRKTLI
jgi:hypothetical protein